MRFLQIHTFYTAYWQAFYRDHPELVDIPYAQQLDALQTDGFSAGHLVAPHMNALGYETGLIIANCLPLQKRWCVENGIPFSSTEMIVREQITRFQPDVLYLSDPITFDSHFVRLLPVRPRLILGWRAAAIPDHTDWTAFDLILSSTQGCLQTALRHGATRSAYGLPGFAAEQAERYARVKRRFNVSFIGSWSRQHAHRNGIIHALARAAETELPELAPYLRLYRDSSIHLPDACARYDYGEAWGSGMYAIMAASHMTLNASIEMAQSEAPNMRHMEATGMGALLLTERVHNLEAFFRPDQIATFANDSDMLEQATYYLSHPAEMASTAARGQAHCLHHYTMQVRAKAMELRIRQILQSHIQNNRMTPDLAIRTAKALASTQEAKEDKQHLRDTIQRKIYAYSRPERDSAAYAYAWRLLSPQIPPDGRAMHAEAMRGLCAAADGDMTTARQALDLELENWPENDDARFALSRLFLQRAQNGNE